MKRLFFAVIVLAGLILLSQFPASAQKQANIWYFGEHAGLDFNSGTPVPLTDGVIITDEGCATIADDNGRLLFYTDGVSVWNRLHEQMPNGAGLDGQASSTESAIIIPQPGSKNIFYIFTVDYQVGSKGLRYSVVNMALQSGLGDITIKNIPLTAPTTEKVTAAYHKNQQDIWVITHGRQNNTFYSYLVTSTGVNSIPVMSDAGTAHGGGQIIDPNNSCSQGYMKASPNGKRIAVAVTGLNLFEVLDFDNATGIVSNPITFPRKYISTYGVEFSPDASKLYGTSKKELYQFDLRAGSPAAIINSALLIASQMGENWSNGGLQLGPDGKIYIANIIHSASLAVIHHPNRKGLACTYEENGLHLGDRDSSKLGLPCFIANYLNISHLTISYTGNCIKKPVAFSITPPSVIDSIEWNFDDIASGTANTSLELQPSHLFSTPGTYTVSTKVYWNGKRDTLLTVVHVADIPDVQLGNDTTFCEERAYVLFVPQEPGLLYRWSTGDTVPVLSVKKSGTYWISVSNGECSAGDTIRIEFSSFVLSASKDTSICPGETVPLRAMGASTYHWSPSDGLSNTEISDPVAAPVKTTTYTVTGSDKSGCTHTTSVTISVNTPPHVSLGADTTICKDDYIVLNAESPGLTYLWSTGEHTPSILVNKTGPYWVHISDGHCDASDTIQIKVEDASFFLGDTIRVCNTNKYILSAESPGLTYLWSTGETTPQIEVHSTGNYWVQVFNGKCAAADTVYLDFSTFAVSLWPDTLIACTPEYTLTGMGQSLPHQWSTGETTPNIHVSKTGLYWVEISNGICRAADTVYLIFPHLAVTATPDATICEGQSIQLEAKGAQTYHWSPSTGLTAVDIADPLATPDHTTVYTVTGSDTYGCTDTHIVTITVEKMREIQFSLPDVLAPPGEESFHIPLYASTDASSFPIILHSVKLNIRVSAELFIPSALTYGSYTLDVVNDEYTLHIDLGDVTLTHSEQAITEIEGTVLLHRLPSSTPLSFLSAQVENCARIGALSDGSLTLDPNSICGGIFGRNIQFTRITTIWSTPNPSWDNTNLHASIVEKGEYRVIIFDLRGQVLWQREIHQTSSTQELYEFIIPSTELPAGAYQAVLYTASGAKSVPLHVAR